MFPFSIIMVLFHLHLKNSRKKPINYCRELESSSILLTAVDRYSSAQLELVQRLQRDEELQRAAVCSLLERSDARTWGLVQQVALVEKQLAQLTALELQRKNHQLSEQLVRNCFLQNYIKSNNLFYF